MKADRNLNRLRHMEDAYERIRSVLSDCSRECFLTNRDKQDIVIRNVIILGEASRYTDESLKAHYPEIPWQAMIDLRNAVTHEYMRVDYVMVWNTIMTLFAGLDCKLNDARVSYPWPCPDGDVSSLR